MKQIEDYIWDLEKQLFERQLSVPLEDLIHDDFIEFSSSGRVFGKAELLKAGLNGDHKYSSADSKVRFLSDDLIQVTYVSSIDGEKALRSSLWKKQGEKWQMIFHQGMVFI